jgi:hypothetical protein
MPVAGWPGFGSRRRDVSWAVEDGPAVRGPILALLLVISGRPAGLTQLAGAGVDDLTISLAASP